MSGPRVTRGSRRDATHEAKPAFHGHIGSMLVPGCPRCGGFTVRVDNDHRRCDLNHRLAIIYSGGDGGEWQVRAC